MLTLWEELYATLIFVTAPISIPVASIIQLICLGLTQLWEALTQLF